MDATDAYYRYYRYTYNQYGDLIKRTVHKNADSKNVKQKTLYEYDKNRNLIKREHYYNSLGGSVMDRYATYEYDTQNHLLNETVYGLGNKTKKMYIDYIIDFNYDSNGNKTEYSYKRFDEDGTISGQRVFYYDYDAQGREVKIERDYNGDGIYSIEYYTYDANGREIKYERDSDGDGKIDSTGYYTYDANGREIKYERDSDGDGKIDSTGYYTYDANGREIKYERDSDSDGKIDYVRYRAYDTEGRRVKDEVDRDGDGKIDNVITIGYDSNGYEIEFKSIDSSGYTEIYKRKYDEMGNILEAHRKNAYEENSFKYIWIEF